METEFTEDQRQFREVVARFLADKSPPTAVRELMASKEGYDPVVWQQLCGEVGLAGTHIPEVYGGFGFGPVELGIIAEEMGRYLYCGPFFASSVMAAETLLAAADEEKKMELLPGIATGSTIATLVLDDLNCLDRAGASITATESGKGVRLSGSASIVVDAHHADLLIVVADCNGEIALFAVPGNSAGLVIEPLDVIDPTRKLSKVCLNQVAAEKIGTLGAEKLSRIWDRLCITLAHEMIGGAQELLDSTVAYTKIRVQFGRPIGSFQALKHRCADLLMELELAKSATYYAAQCLACNEGEPYAPSMVKAMASETYLNIARAAIQLRGGIGFTWENDTHLWFKRAKSSEVFLGTPHLHRERMMSIIEENAHA